MLFGSAEPAWRKATGTQPQFGALLYLFQQVCMPTAYSQFYATCLPSKDGSKQKKKKPPHNWCSAKCLSIPIIKPMTMLHTSSPYHTARVWGWNICRQPHSIKQRETKNKVCAKLRRMLLFPFVQRKLLHNLFHSDHNFKCLLTNDANEVCLCIQLASQKTQSHFLQITSWIMLWWKAPGAPAPETGLCGAHTINHFKHRHPFSPWKQLALNCASVQRCSAVLLTKVVANWKTAVCLLSLTVNPWLRL